MADPYAEDPGLLWAVGQELLGAAEAGLEAAGETAPARSIVVAGTNPAWDECCPGQLTVRLARVFITGDFPNEQPPRAQPGCGVGSLAGEYLVEVALCSPAADGEGNAPPAQAVDDHARRTLTHALAVLRGLMCWAASRRESDPFAGSALARSLEPIGEQGACVGYFVRVLVELADPCPCADPAL